MKLPVEIYSTESVRRMDRNAIAVAGIPGYTLMERAATAALELARGSWPEAGRWHVVCGGGNNGGDGFVLARLAGQQGISVRVSWLVPPDALRGDAATAYRDLVDSGAAPAEWDGQLDEEADLLVDAILGSGLERNVEGRFADAVGALCRHAAPVLALDIPSGISGDTGEVMGCAVRAAKTITFVGLKIGLFLGDAPDFVGRLSFAGLGIPDSARTLPALLRRIDAAAIKPLLAPRPRASHKGDFGHLLLVGSGPGMAGAIRLAGEAALRTGAGRVSIATHPAHDATVAAGCPELMCHGVRDRKDLQTLLERTDTVAIGPGLGTDGWAKDLLEAVLASGLPTVVDADALNLLAQSPVRSETWILTPHPGEAARLLRSSGSAVQAGRIDAARRLAEQYGGTVVLKGAGTLVSSVDGPPWLCTAGNPGMAAPGMGDVLTGVIGALLAQGFALEEAAVAGVSVHAQAGDRAAGATPRGLMASDLMPALRTEVNP
ncbi:MAG TPA: NAD(P)H-hydrate dehydratase [Woeseiaceae bacterium]|nr:NAD(P)H-hydrate dehydratase [Woeseiaceae bacterium]